jgi:hypothetical protein
MECRIGRMRAHHDHQRVAVRVGLGGRRRADHRSGARAVLDDDRLAPVFLHALRDHAPEHVDRAAGRIRHDDPDRLLGISVGG